jgi:hypothetical protein
MTQPTLSRKQWEAVVHKMVKTYGAPISPAEEGEVVEYLVTARSHE